MQSINHMSEHILYHLIKYDIAIWTQCPLLITMREVRLIWLFNQILFVCTSQQVMQCIRYVKELWLNYEHHALITLLLENSEMTEFDIGWRLTFYIRHFNISIQWYMALQNGYKIQRKIFLEIVTQFARINEVYPPHNVINIIPAYHQHYTALYDVSRIAKTMALQWNGTILFYSLSHSAFWVVCNWSYYQ